MFGFVETDPDFRGITVLRTKERGGFLITVIYAEASVAIEGTTQDQKYPQDLIISGIGITPESKRSQGYGSRGLRVVLEAFSYGHAYSAARATQVQAPAVTFWLKNRFQPTHNETNDYLYTFRSESGDPQ